MNVPSMITQSLSSTKLRDFVAAHRAFVKADVKRMVFADDAFAEHGGGDRDIAILRPAPSTSSCRPKRWISTPAMMTGLLAA